MCDLQLKKSLTGGFRKRRPASGRATICQDELGSEITDEDYTGTFGER